MWYGNFITAVVWAFFIVWFFALAFGRRGPWDSLWWFFVAVFIGSWAVGMWMNPVGPAWRGVSYLPILFAGLLIALLLSAASTPQRPRRRDDISRVPPQTSDQSDAPIVGGFFWIFILLIIAAILTSFWRVPRI